LLAALQQDHHKRHAIQRAETIRRCGSKTGMGGAADEVESRIEQRNAHPVEPPPSPMSLPILLAALESIWPQADAEN